jgi:hypothetical protein
MDAANRLVSTAEKSCSIELPRFRYMDDVTRYLSNMRSDIEDSENLIKVTQKALASVAKVKIDAQKIDPDIKKKVVPSLSKLKSQYGLIEDLYEKHRTLESVESQIALQFPERRGEVYEKTTATLRELKKKVEQQLRAVLDFLRDISDKHEPKSFGKYRQAVIQELQEQLHFRDSEQYLYASTADSDLLFTSYFLLNDVLTEDGRTVPNLYVSVQWVVGSCVYVHVSNEFELPEDLMHEQGTACKTMAETVTAISTLLNAEGFFNKQAMGVK